MRKKNVNRRTRPAKEFKNLVKKATTAMAMGPIILFAAPTQSVNFTTLASELTAYYLQHKDTIHTELEIGLFDGNHSINRNFTYVPNVIDELALTEIETDDFLHQHVPTSASTFNPQANVLTPKARKLKMRAFEGDLQFQDKLIQKTHLMYLGKMKQLANSNSPDKEQTFVEYLFWDVIMAKAKRTLRKAIFQASFDDTAPFSWLKILDGWETLIAAAVTAAEIAPITVGSATTSNIIGKVETVFDTLSTEVKGAADLVCALRSDHYALWVRADRAANGRNSSYDSNGTLTIDGYSNCKVIEEPDFTTTKIAIYRTSNPVVSTSSGDGTWEFQRADRLTKMMLSGDVGLQFTSINSGGFNNIAVGQ